MRTILIGLLSLALVGALRPVQAGTLDSRHLQQEFTRLSLGFKGRVGVCAQDSRVTVCYQGEQRFSLQSVMKLLVAIAVLDAADQRKLALSDKVLVRRQDLSLYVQPLADLVGSKGYATTVSDLLRRAVVDSDSAATDILVARLGGPAAIQALLTRKGFGSIHFNRDERHLQTEILGLSWRPEYVDAASLNRATEALPFARRDAAYKRYQADSRDTTTPKAITNLLQQLAAGRLLSPASTQHLLWVMTQTVTFPDRLKAGLKPGWTLGHKTGTSSSWQGITAATNDVGILTAPDGTRISMSVLIGDSGAPAAARARLMASLAAATIAAYR